MLKLVRIKSSESTDKISGILLKLRWNITIFSCGVYTVENKHNYLHKQANQLSWFSEEVGKQDIDNELPNVNLFPISIV